MKAIVACLDFSEMTRPVAHVAADLAQATGAHLRLLHALPIVPAPVVAEDMTLPMWVQDLGRDADLARQRMAELEDELRARGCPEVDSILSEAADAASIAAEVDRLHPDLIVIGSHGHGALHHLLVGSTTQRVIRHATCPVVVVPLRAVPAAVE